MNQSRTHRNTKTLELRAKIIASIRRYFEINGYLEVETPCRIPAPAPEAHIDAEPSGSWFLQTSPELCMKRLLAAGIPRIYQICKCFRQWERGDLHLPEMTLLEWYTAESDYLAMMRQCEGLISFVAEVAGCGQVLPYGGKRIDLAPPWKRLPVRDAFEMFSPQSLDNALRDQTFDEIIATDIGPNLGDGKPVFLYDYPAAAGSLARMKSNDRTVAERFELYISGMEICNGYSELNDAEEQERRFEAENISRRSRGKNVYPMPEKFLNDLTVMPDAAGNALGIDRLVMLFADAAHIDDVVAFIPEDL